MRAEIERMSESDDLIELLTNTRKIHGHHCVGSAMGVLAAHRAMKELGVKESTGMEHFLAIVETNNCFSDGVQVVTGCTYGYNVLIYRDFGKTAFTLLKRNREGIRTAAKPEAGVILQNNDLETEQLHRKVLTEKTATVEEEERWIVLNKKHCYDILSIPTDEIFKIEKVRMETPVRYSRILRSYICVKCGENVMETKTTIRGSETLCFPCAEAGYNQLDLSGITIKDTFAIKEK